MSSEQCCGVLDIEFHVRHGLSERRIVFFYSISSIGGVEDEFGGFVSVCLDPFWFRDEANEFGRVVEGGATNKLDFVDDFKSIIVGILDHLRLIANIH